MGWSRRALEQRLLDMDPTTRAELQREAARLRDGVRRAAKVTRGGERRGSGRDAGALPPWTLRMRDADLDGWVLRLLEEQILAGTAPEEVERGVGSIGVVSWTGKKVCHLQAAGETFTATLSGELARNQRAALAVGDEVLWSGEADPRVIRVLPRRTVLARPDPHDPNGEQVIVANVDVVIVVAAAKAPPLRPRLLDRYLVVVARGGARPILCLNKMDQIETAEEEAEISTTLEPYEALGVTVFRTSARTGQGIEGLRGALLGQTAAFVGHSGVGKSSLLNALYPGVDLATGEVNAFHGKGRHTTTAASLLDLGGGTRLIDTPGVRSLSLGRMSPLLLRDAFPEFAPFADTCPYRDCTHTHEPNCAVRAAVERGEISPQRMDSYRRLLVSLTEED